MKNAKEIKAEAKVQIINLLKEMDCYRFDEDGIDLWLDIWEKANDKHITEIAEKSPYYDGKCKIVFPEKYPREFDYNAYHAFGMWLQDHHRRNLEEVKINGISWRDINWYYDVKYRYESFTRMHSVSGENAAREMLDTFDYDEEIFNEFKSVFDEIFKKIDEAYNEFNSGNYISFNGFYYKKEVYENSPSSYATLLSNILTTYNFGQFLTERNAAMLGRYFPNVRFAKGQKLSKAVNAIATKYGLKQDSEWEKEFAKFANAVNPLEVVKWTVISWHPIDYLTFCFGNSWSSCQNIEKKNLSKIKITNSKKYIKKNI